MTNLSLTKQPWLSLNVKRHGCGESRTFKIDDTMYFRTQIVNVIELPPQDTVHRSNWGAVLQIRLAFISAIAMGELWALE